MTIYTKEQRQAQMHGTLIDYDQNNVDVQLKYYNGVYWMFSPKTGIHSLKQEIVNEHGTLTVDQVDERVKLHWEGFKINQNLKFK